MKSQIPFFCLIVLLLTSCKDETPSNLLDMVYDDSYKEVWLNKTEYKETQDYLKNLDFTLLENPNTHPAYKELLEVFKSVMDGESYEIVIPKVQEILSRRNNAVLVQIYTGLLEELLMENSEYKIAFENFPKENKESDFNYAYKDLPKTALSTINTNDKVLEALEKTNHGQIKIKCKANDITEFAMFDTGADLTVVSKSFANKSGFFIDESKTIEINTVTSNKVFAHPGYIQELQVGNTLFKNHHILVFEDKDVTFQDDEASLKLDFVLGWNAIRQLAVVLNTTNNSYQAEVSTSHKTNFKNLFWCGYPGVKVNSEDGQSLIFGLDTGSSETELKTNAKHKINFSTPLVKDTLHVGGFGGSEKYVLDIAKQVSLYLDSHRITFKELPLRENTDLFFIRQDGTLGAEIFNNNVITIDYKNGIFKITP